MRKQRINALQLSISRQGLTLLGSGGWLRRHTEVLREVDFGSEELPELSQVGLQLDAALRDAKCVRLPVTVVVADDLARFFMVTPPGNTRHLQDCHAAAEMRFHTLYGEPIDGWQLAADWNFRNPFLACALPRPLLQSVQLAADTHRLTLIEIVPQFIAAWNACAPAFKSNAWFGVVHGHALTLAAIKDGQLLSVRLTEAPEDVSHNKHWLMQHVTREALRLNTDVPEHVQLHGDVSGHWLSQSEGGLRCEHLHARTSGVAELRTAGVALVVTGVRQ